MFRDFQSNPTAMIVFVFLPCSFASVLLHVMRHNLKLCCWIKKKVSRLRIAIFYYKQKYIYMKLDRSVWAGMSIIEYWERAQEYMKSKRSTKNIIRDDRLSIKHSPYSEHLVIINGYVRYWKIYYQSSLVNDFKFEGKMMQWE